MHLPSVPHVASTLRVDETHSRSVWQPPSTHLPALQRLKPGQSPSPWQGDWQTPLRHCCPPEQSVSPAHCTHLPPAHLRPVPLALHSVSVVHLLTHLLCSQSTFAVSHLQRISYCWHAVVELVPASATQRLRRFEQLDGGVPQQSAGVVHSMSAHSRAVTVMPNVATVQMLMA